MKHESFGYTFLSHVVAGLPKDIRKEMLEEQEQWRRSVPTEVHAMQRGSLTPEDRERIDRAFGRIAEKLGIRAEIEEILGILSARRPGPQSADKSPAGP